MFGLFGFWIVDASISNTGSITVLLSLCSNVFVVRLLIDTRPAAEFGGGVLLCWFVCVATSYEGHMVDALASRADEGRRSLR